MMTYNPTDTIPLLAVLQDNGTPITGATLDDLRIVRDADGYYWTGSDFQAADYTLTMTELTNAGQDGLYRYPFASPAAAGTFRATASYSQSGVNRLFVWEFQTRAVAETGDEMALIDGAITEAKIATQAITNVKLAPNCVTSIHLASGCIGSTELADTAAQKIATWILLTALPGSPLEGTIGELLNLLDTNIDAKITEARLAATGLDAISAAEPTVKPTTFAGWLMWLVQRQRRATMTPTELIVKTEAGATVTTQALSDDDVTQELGAPT